MPSFGLHWQHLGRDPMLPIVVASDPAHDANAPPVEALAEVASCSQQLQPRSLRSTSIPSHAKEARERAPRKQSSVLNGLKRNAPRPENSLLQLGGCHPRQSDSGHDDDGYSVVKVLAEQ